ncbi:hypothetical protein ACOME3_000861 [Neoechinorhynchus agilis]
MALSWSETRDVVYLTFVTIIFIRGSMHIEKILGEIESSLPFVQTMPTHLGSSQEVSVIVRTALDFAKAGKIQKAGRMLRRAVLADPNNGYLLGIYAEFFERYLSNPVVASHLYFRSLINEGGSNALSHHRRLLPIVSEIDCQCFEEINRELARLYKVSTDHGDLEIVHRDAYLSYVFHSTAIHGNKLGMSEIEFLLERKLAVAGRPLVDHQEVVGVDDALHFIKVELRHLW